MIKGLSRAAAVVALGAAGLWSQVGNAEQVLVSQSSLVRGTQSVTATFDVSSRGTVTVKLADLDWPTALANLSFVATSPTAVMASLSAPGQISFDVSGPGAYSAIVSGKVRNDLFKPGLGAFGLVVSFVSAVPLPASAILLLSGLGALAATLFRRRPLASLAAQLQPRPVG